MFTYLRTLLTTNRLWRLLKMENTDPNQPQQNSQTNSGDAPKDVSSAGVGDVATYNDGNADANGNTLYVLVVGKVPDEDVLDPYGNPTGEVRSHDDELLVVELPSKRVRKDTITKIDA